MSPTIVPSDWDCRWFQLFDRRIKSYKFPTIVFTSAPLLLHFSRRQLALNFDRRAPIQKIRFTQPKGLPENRLPPFLCELIVFVKHKALQSHNTLTFGLYTLSISTVPRRQRADLSIL